MICTRKAITEKGAVTKSKLRVKWPSDDEHFRRLDARLRGQVSMEFVIGG